VVPTLEPSSGGPSRSVLGLARAQANAGASIQVVASGTHRPPHDGLEVHLGPLLLKRFALPAPGLLDTLKQAIQSADIVHLHSLWNGVITKAALLARQYRTPFVLSPRGMLDLHNMRRRDLFKKLYLQLVEHKNLNALAGFHFLDETERAGCTWLEITQNRPSIIQSNGLDLMKLRQAVAAPSLAIHKQFCFDATVRNLVFLGRLNVIKGLELQLEVLRELHEVGEHVQLHWIGPDDGEWEKLRQLAEKLGVLEQLHWHGPIYGADRLSWLKAADAVLLTSHYECNSNTAAETLALGGVLVATDTCHLAHVALAGGARVVPRDRTALTSALLDIFRNGSVSAKLRSAAIEFAESNLAWDPLGRKMLDFYGNLLELNR
jgi:glycosyltransferase involved in cell wall biosynthesis